MTSFKPSDLPMQNLATDVKGMQDLRYKAKSNPQEGLHAAAQQFESMFLQMVLKSMRDATPQDGLFDSEATRFFTSMSDQQMAQHMSTTGQLGFARMIEQQLGKFAGGNPLAAQSSPDTIQQVINELPARRAAALAAATPLAQPVPANTVAAANFAGTAANAANTVNGVAGLPAGVGSPSQNREFVNRVWPFAVEASQATGVPAQFLVAHAALESGWGRAEPRLANGQPSYNLFGVKAGRNWSGNSVDVATTEYVNGEPQATHDRFRAYSSYAEAFRDYATLLQRPRFAGALGQQNGTDFARSLQQAGYATDPMYADKLSRIINGATLRQALVG
jgi:flagellar protein FlgJ